MKFRISQRGTYPNFKIEYRRWWFPFWRQASSETLWIPYRIMDRMYYPNTYKTLADAEEIVHKLIEHRKYLYAKYHVVKEF